MEGFVADEFHLLSFEHLDAPILVLVGRPRGRRLERADLGHVHWGFFGLYAAFVFFKVVEAAFQTPFKLNIFLHSEPSSSVIKVGGVGYTCSGFNPIFRLSHQ